MKLLDHFREFMTEIVNLNDTRVDQLEKSIVTLKGVIRGSAWGPKVSSFEAQGSWAHKTIIRPVGDNAFDADLLAFVEPVEGWDARKYLTTLRSVFVNLAPYEGKVTRSSHCVTIEYAGERKIDIAPCVVDRTGIPRFEVCNHDRNEFEESEPKKYTDWFVQRNAWTGGNGLRKVTRLLKYLRDIKGTFTCPSVLFTTLLGYRIDWLDDANSKEFNDLPTSLKTIMSRLDNWLQTRPLRPAVTNPVLPSEAFSDLWDDAQYANFRERIHTYRAWIDDAYDETDLDESIGKWQRVFGDQFAKNAAMEKAALVSEDAASRLSESTVLAGPSSLGDLVALFTRFGRQILPKGFDRLPHKHRPRWPALSIPPFRVSVVANRHTARNGAWVAPVASGDGPLPKHQWLQFRARTEDGSPLAANFEVHWRVTNTDRAAREADCLRGWFDRGNDGASRWERLQYRGVHSVEAFVVRVDDQMLVSQSDPFYVVIE